MASIYVSHVSGPLLAGCSTEIFHFSQNVIARSDLTREAQQFVTLRRHLFSSYKTAPVIATFMMVWYYS
jgi:uncharacterized protein (UPF0333 family)